MPYKKVKTLIPAYIRYIPALLLIALFSLFVYINVEQIIKSMQDDANVINTSGRQRMLSQNLVLQGLKYLDNPTDINKSRLKKSMELMRISHKHLISYHKSDKLNIIYYEKKLSLKVNDFLAKFDDFLNNRKDLIIELSYDAQVLLPLLSEAVTEYENINKMKVKPL